MGNFIFGQVSVSSNKKLQNLVKTDLVVYDAEKDNYPLYIILLDYHYSPTKIKSIVKFLNKHLKSYKLLNASLIDPAKENIKGGIVNFYKMNKTNFEQEIAKRDCVVMTVGSALYSIAREDLQVGYFYDSVTNPQTYFFSKTLKRWVYPLVSFSEILTFGRSIELFYDTYKTNFNLLQFKKANENYESHINDQEVDEVEVISIDSTEQFIKVLRQHRRYTHIAWDLETSGFHFIRDKIGVLTFSFDGKTGYIVPWSLVDKKELNDFLATKKQIGANLKFDVKFLWFNGVPNANIHEDIVQLGHILNELRSNSLKTNAWIYTRHGGYEFELDDFVEKTGTKDYTKIPMNLLSKYATMDAIVTYQVWKAQMKHLEWVDKNFPNEKSNGYSMSYYYKDIVIPSLRAFCKMEYDGIYVSVDKLELVKEELLKKIDEIETELRSSFGVNKTFDFNSLPSLGRLLKEKGWRSHGESKAGYYLTGEEQLHHWTLEGHYEAKLLSELRSVRTLLSTFIGTKENEGWRKHIVRHKDGTYRMHATYAHMLADTGRSKCKDPNLQQIPKEGPVPKVIDVPNSDYVMLSIDYSSLQVRLAGIDAKDESLKGIYGVGGIKDFHSNTAFPIFAKGKKFVEVTLEDGSKTHYFHTDRLFVMRKSKKIQIYASELEPDDEIID